MTDHSHSQNHNRDKKEKDLESRNEIVQVILAAIFVIVVITAWVLTR